MLKEQLNFFIPFVDKKMFFSISIVIIELVKTL